MSSKSGVLISNGGIPPSPPSPAHHHREHHRDHHREHYREHREQRREPREPKRDTIVYIGEIPRSINKEEIEKMFRNYGHVTKIWLSQHPWGFGFIDFEDTRDAEDAVRALNGR
jgi:RNA recognition motif-containing protein